MFLISKIIRDPNPESRWLKQGNLMGRTIGFVLHTPKFFKCRGYDFYTSQFDTMRNGRPLDEETMERRYLSKLEHTNCSWLRRHSRSHLSYPGYIYFIAPKRRYQFHYMGDINPQNKSFGRWGYIRPHKTYTRWLDNGEQNPPKKPVDDEKLDRALAIRREEFHGAMESSRQQMEEYARVRSGGSR